MNDRIVELQEEMPGMGLRERKKRLAQTTIEETALRLFQQQGYENTSIQDIADAVMMSPRTFFRYFASKEEVLLGPMREIQSDGLRFLQRVASTESPQAVLKATIGSIARRYQEEGASFLLRYQVAVQVPSIASIYAYINMEKEPIMCEMLCAHPHAGRDRNQIRFLVAMYMTILRVALTTWLEQGAQGDLEALLQEFLAALPSLSEQALNAGDPG